MIVGIAYLVLKVTELLLFTVNSGDLDLKIPSFLQNSNQKDLNTAVSSEAVNLSVIGLSGRNSADQSSANAKYARSSIHPLSLSLCRMLAWMMLCHSITLQCNAQPRMTTSRILRPRYSATLHEAGICRGWVLFVCPGSPYRHFVCWAPRAPFMRAVPEK